MPDDIKTGIGASVKRKEDLRFITGKGNYTDDINRPGQLYAYMLRSNVANGSIKLDISDAEKSDGVVSIFVGNDMEVGGLPCGWQVDSADGTAMREPPHPPIAKDEVKYVGEIIAVVVAESLDKARSASEKIEVDYSEQTPVVDLKSALEANNGVVHKDLETNICFDWQLGDAKAVDDALNSADHISEINIRNNRLIPNAIETRCAIGDYDI
jgi:carbon-monoxide dehydrogenase large subunit